MPSVFRETGPTASKTTHRLVTPIAATLFVVALCATTATGELTPRAKVIKPRETTLLAGVHCPDEIYVKFVDGMQVRLRNGVMTDVSAKSPHAIQAAVEAVPNATWSRSHEISEETLSELRANAEKNLGQRIADLNLEYRVKLPDGMDAAQAIDALNQFDIVEIALPVPLPMAPPTPPNYQSSQRYLDAPTSGVNTPCMWQLPGGTGGHSSVADVEYSWNFDHEDLSPTTLLGASPIDPFGDNNHGTAVLGEMGSLNNGWGTTGIAYDCTMYAVAANTAAGYNVGSAITTALATLGPGDVILIEQQISGPNYTGDPPGTQNGLVPVEWYQPYYSAIRTAVGSGVVVVEAAGNGAEDLDSSIYSTGNGGHWPFLPGRDSGAIIVGAGASPISSTTDRSRLSFSNYGSTVDLQGYGENVYTTGYGDVYSSEGVDRWFTRRFSGTSSASPIVAGACMTLQSAHFGATGAFLSPSHVRTHLRNTGSPQQSGGNPASQNIGPRPDAAAALCEAVPAIDANGNLIPDLCDGLADIGACCFLSGSCTDTTADNCTANGGTPKAVGTTCAESDCWGDATPPTPNPMTWEVVPAPGGTDSITMTASVASDDEHDVQYAFFSGSGAAQTTWMSSRAFTKNGLSTNFPYSYKVKARDTSPHYNETDFSTPDYWTATAIQTPTGITFASVADTEMDVTATGTFSNLNFGESGLYFEMTPAEGTGANVWTSGTTSATIHVSGLTPGQTYTFRVKARNYYGSRGGAYETAYTTTYQQATSGGGQTCDTTFGDINADSIVNGDDIAGFVRAKLDLPPESGENQACADNGGSVEEDIQDFIDILLN